MGYRDAETALRARVQQLEQQVSQLQALQERARQLAEDNLRLQSEVDTLRAELAALRPAPPAPPLADSAQNVPGRLLFAVSHPSRPTRVLGFDQDIIKIGRNANCHLVLDDDSVSRMHAVVESRDEAQVIIDLGSSTGTLVNGKKINKAKLSAGDKIRIGAFELLVGIRG